jgi:hypothetical protein
MRSRVGATMTNNREALHQSKSNEWYTPYDYTNSARIVMGDIDLDPASCENANRHVRAKRIFTQKEDGLEQLWWGRVFMNPPYGRKAAAWVQKALDEYEKWSRVKQAILLVNAVPDRRWFQPLFSYPICFVSYRIQFISGETGEPEPNPTHGNAFVYLGVNEAGFIKEFSKYGRVVRAL